MGLKPLSSIATPMSGLHCWVSGDKSAPSGIEGKSFREV
ncbi:hypothetical protein FORC31_p018 (plasmid) [Escherichia coli]|nr:hypothetical protein FORC31_p018 [Escherichia coli]